MRKHTFKKKLLSVTLSALTAFSAGTVALTTAYNLPATVVYAADSLTPQESKLLKAEEKMIMGMAKEVFKDIPFFGNLVDGFDSILDLTDAFGSGGGGESISKEDLKELREHLDEELEKINLQIASLGDQLLNELGNEMYTMKIGDVIDDMYSTAVRDAERINTHLSDDSLTENEKLVEIAALIGRSNTWTSSEHKIAKFWKVANLISGETVTKIDSKNLYDTIYEYFAKKTLFSSEAYDKATSYIDKIVYEFLYSQSVLAQCLEASLKVANFTDEEIAALSPTQKSIVAKSTVKSVEDEIGAEAMMLFNFHDQKSFISLYSNYLYNTENSRYTYVDNGKALKAVSPELGSFEPGSENDVGTIRIVKTDGSNDTNAHKTYNNEKTRLQNALNDHQYISSAKLGEMGSYVSANYKSTKTVWDFLKDRGFSITAPDNNTNMLVTNAKVKEWGKTNSENKGDYNKDQNEGYTGFVYNNESLTPEDVNLYVLNHKKEHDSFAYQVISYTHYYKTYTPDSIKSKPVRIFFFEEPTFKNDSAFNYDASTNTLTVNAKATGATGRQSVKVQYRADSDDAWTTSYASTLSMTLKGGCDYEVRTVISDEAGHKETTDTFYCSTPASVNYIDADGTEKSVFANKIEDSSVTELTAGWYAVNSDIELDSRITCKGDVHLILCDGCMLTVPNGITVNENEATLTIYGQKDGTGTVDAGSQSASWAAIGGTRNNSGGLITINGGTIIAKGNYAGAGIGGGQRHGGTAKIVINGGTINAEASQFGAGIGGGARGDADITINGGNISVNGRLGHGGAGTPTADIKLSWKKSTDSITVGNYYGKVTLEKYFTDGENTFAPGEVANNSTINNRTLTPGEAVTYYIVTWKNWDGTVLKTDTNVKQGTIPVYDGETPAKPSDEQNTYTFTGWSPEISVAAGNAAYTAQFSSVPRTYGEPVWDWAEDYESAEATFIDSGNGYKKSISGAIIKNETADKTTYTATVEFNGKTYTDTITPLKNLSVPSSYTIGKDGKVTIYCLSEYGLSKEVFYTVKYTTTGDEPTPYWYTLQTDSENSVIEFIPANLNFFQKTGKYTFKVEAVNILENGKRYTDTKTFVVDVGDPFINTSSVYHTFHPVGERVSVDCKAEGGMGMSTDTLFSIYYKPSTSDTWTPIVEWSGRSYNMYFVPKTAGQYDVRVEAFDMLHDQVVATSVKDITVIAHEPLVNNSSISAEFGYNAYAPITINCSAEGGVGSNIVYNVSYKRTNYFEEWTALQNESTNTTVLFTPVSATLYTIRVTAVNIVDGYDEHIKVYKDFEVYVNKHTHSFGEPAWSWSDDHSAAKAVFTCTDCKYTETVDATVTMEDGDKATVYTAAVTFNGTTYTDTYTEEKPETYVYYPAAEPYIDNNGEYILGYKEHYRYQGKYYAVNSDKSVGDEITDIWISYFKFALLPDDTYAIEYYTGKTKDLTEIVIPKTFNGKKITTLGTDNLDVFIKAGKPQFELVLNENITEIKPCAFNKIGVTKVTGDTSGLNMIGEYAFAWVNKTGGYALDITLSYPGMITTGDAIFNQVNATLHIGHGTTFSNTNFRATSLTYDFTDAHIYSEPTWTWDDDYSYWTATFTCTHPGCGHQQTEQSELIGIDRMDKDSAIKSKSGDYNVEIVGYYSGRMVDADDVLEGVNKLTVIFKDKNGNKVTPPQYIWTVKEIAPDTNGGVDLTEGSKYFVQLRSPDGETIYSPWIPVDLLGGGSDLMNVSSPDTNAETINSPRMPVESLSVSDQINESSANEIVSDPDMPKTGDTTPTATIIAILLSGLTATLFLAAKRKRNQQKK